MSDHLPSAAPDRSTEPFADTAPAAATRLPGGLALLHRDTHLIVIAKPAGLAVHPGPRTPASLEDYLPALAFDNHRLPIICHRLDRDTSGCLVLARHPRAVKRMAALFETGAIYKTYWALLDALPGEPAGTIDAPLLKQSSAAAGWRMIIDPRGKRAITHWRVLDPAIRLVEFRLETGRTHQLRVHSASIGCPITGDPVYGVGGAPMRLHARALVIPYDAAAPLCIAGSLPPDWPAAALHFDRD